MKEEKRHDRFDKMETRSTKSIEQEKKEIAISFYPSVSLRSNA